MFVAALGCNLAWGLVDAVMYLVRTVTDRGQVAHARPLRCAPRRTRKPVAGSSSARCRAVAAGLVSPAEIEAIRGRIVALSALPARPDAASGTTCSPRSAIFLIVVASTFPVVLPFALFDDVGTAKNVSRVIALAMLFLGRARARPLRRLRQLEGRVHDGRVWARRSWSRSTRSADEVRAAASSPSSLAAVVARDGARRRGRRQPGAALRVPTKPSWEFAITAYPTVVRGGENYTSAIAAADRGPLHLEARYNYESIGARSAFVGWTFSGGETITWELTPLLGGAWGTMQAFVPGLEASVAWGSSTSTSRPNTCATAHERTDSYIYAWSELGFRPVEWLRVGLAGQRTRAYGGERDFQRGPFAQVTWGPVTIGGYWFNPGSSDQVFVGSIGATF